MYGGHAKTIKPDKRRLALLFDNPNVRYNLWLSSLTLWFVFGVLIMAAL